MRLALLALPLAMLGLAGCVDVYHQPAPRQQTIVTPEAAPAPTVVAPPGTTATVVTRP